MHDRTMPYVYILRCSDNTYYVGSTFNLERRLWQHKSDTEGALYTRRRRPVELAWSGW
jgi:predicted GIY-YIG superfamily endonuclease